MLVAKGYDVGFKIDNTKMVMPKSYALLHDESGADWSYCSCLIGSFQKTKETVEDAAAERYFGYPPRAGKLVLPSSNLAEWKLIGSVSEIDYSRPGEHKDDYYHPFSSGWWIFKRALPELYRKHTTYRLELGPGCEVNWRGFVYP